jgi:pimeloyl-ACP methyl ester carboxylesterase
MARVLAIALVLLGLLLAAPVTDARVSHHHRAGRRLAGHNGVIFVHGFSGSGAQFESQKMRFTSNGYAGSYVTVLEYDSTNTSPPAEQQIFTNLDGLIAHMKAITHRRKVDLVAHSLGTKLMQDYLNSSAQRAANVAHYVNVDGQTADSPPGGVPTLALWATKGPTTATPGRSIKHAKNVTIPDSTHVQCATSSLSFYWMYKFFNGNRSPRTSQITLQRGRITLSGRAVNFPQNAGLAGSTVQVWPINQATGQRTSARPIASYSIHSTGDWGPVTVQSGRRYEFALVRTDNPSAPLHHFYYERFVHSDHLIRLLESDPVRTLGGPPDSASVAMVLLRYKELWGDQGSENDVLTLNGLNVCTPTTCPVQKLVNALFAADFDRDQMSNTSVTWPPYQAIMFVSSVDVFMPAHSPPTGKVTVGIKSRGKGPERKLTFPNFPGTSDVVTVQLDDFDQTTTPAPKCTSRRGHKCAGRKGRRH